MFKIDPLKPFKWLNEKVNEEAEKGYRKEQKAELENALSANKSWLKNINNSLSAFPGRKERAILSAQLNLSAKEPRSEPRPDYGSPGWGEPSKKEPYIGVSEDVRDMNDSLDKEMEELLALKSEYEKEIERLEKEIGGMSGEKQSENS
jgi:hypothetical protein